MYSSEPDGAEHQAFEDAEAMIKAADAKCTDHVVIAGRQHLQLLLQLARRGFLHASCRAIGRSPNIAGERSIDVLLVPNLRSEAELAEILDGLGHDLNKDGIIVIGDESAAKSSLRQRIRHLLTTYGFTPNSRRKAGRSLLRACKRDAVAVLAA